MSYGRISYTLKKTWARWKGGSRAQRRGWEMKKCMRCSRQTFGPKIIA